MAVSRAKRPRILILNASLAGDAGNTAVALERMQTALARKAEVRVATLKDAAFSEVRRELDWAGGFVFATGTHWDSWSSVLQKFLEDATEAEGTKLWLGKPAACVVTEHSVGGKDVLSRLQGVLVTLGCAIPPMSGVILSKVAQIAREHAPEAAEDFWCADDLKIAAHNLVETAAGTRKWKAWPVDRTDFAAKWIR
ncbi:MAG: NAD(P)H-dependent oxidoreductase [Nibricoccus sp.]